MSTGQENAAALKAKIETGSAVVGILGLGYVGLPLGIAVAEKGFRVLGFDTDPEKVEKLGACRSYIKYISNDRIGTVSSAGSFVATTDPARIAEADILLICVPTPLTRNRDPDLSAVEATTATISRYLRPGQLVVLESTTYPGTSTEVLRPILERSGLACGEQFFLAYSPEREDPGNAEYSTTDIPKVVGGETPEALDLAVSFYSRIVPQITPVSSTQTAEAVKLLENIFRAVNIALVNELKLVFQRMGIDVWEVIEAAKTKPFGYMPFYPGPGLGGHCIPIDPFYLTWKAREYGISTKFIELAGDINAMMPHWVTGQIAEAIDASSGKGLRSSAVLLIGLSYKKNVDDVRESPACVIYDLLEARGAHVAYYDPHVPSIPNMRNHPQLAGRKSITLNPQSVSSYDCAVIVTDHDEVDYEMIVANSKAVIDTRNICTRLGIRSPNIYRG